MNAAVHAYDGPGGEFEFSARSTDGEIAIVVSDYGTGIRPRPSFNSPTARLGLLVMAALAQRLVIQSRANGGTTIRAEVAKRA
jgi:anti-sigma regulatory factor (Ser/Thr protein kinase)